MAAELPLPKILLVHSHWLVDHIKVVFYIYYLTLDLETKFISLGNIQTAILN